MQLRTLEELFVYGAKVISGDVEYEPIEFIGESVDFNIIVRGDSWNRKLDVRSARYILQLTEVLKDIAEDIGVEIDPSCLLVKIDLREGSGDWLGDLKEFAKSTFTPMTPKQTFITLILAMGCATAYFVHGNVAKVQELEAHERTKIEAIQALRNVAEENRSVYSYYEKPVKNLVNSLGKDDTLQIAGSEEIGKQEAKKALLKQVRSRESTTYADGEYVLTDINYKQGELIIFIEQDGIPVKAYTSQLSDEDKAALFDAVKVKQFEEDLPFTMNFQINIHYTQKRILFGSIIGLGGPRADRTHIRLNQVPLP